MSENGTKSPRKIAIVGTAEPHWRAAPYHDESWEIWTCGGIFATAPRTDRHIEIHSIEDTCKGWGQQSPEQELAQRKVYWDWINQQGSTAMVQSVGPEAPNATAFPLDAVLERFAEGYFTNTISYMIALALVEGCEELALYGVDMALTGDPDIEESNEYGLQRPSCEFYLGIAVGAGVKVHMPAETTLLKSGR